MDDLVEKLTIVGLDKPHFLLYLNNVMFEDPLPPGYLLGPGYRVLYFKILKVLYANAFKCDTAAFELIQ